MFRPYKWLIRFFGSEQHWTHLAFFRCVSIFHGLSSRQLGRIMQAMQKRSYQNGEILFLEGQVEKRFSLLNLDGVELTRKHSNGEARSLGILGPGQIFGEMALLEQMARTATATVVEDAVIYLLYTATMESLIRHNPGIGAKLMRNMAVMLSSLLLSDQQGVGPSARFRGMTDQRFWRNVFYLLVLGASLFFLCSVWNIIIPFLIGIAISYLVYPMVDRFVANGLRQDRVVLVLYALLLGTGILLVFFFLPRLIHQAQAIGKELSYAETIDHAIDGLNHWLADTLGRILGHRAKPVEIPFRAGQFIDKVFTSLPNNLQNVAHWGTVVVDYSFC